MKKCAIVTGGASGIGKAISEALSKEGYNVVIADVNEEQGAALAKDIDGYFVPVDLSEQASCRQLIDLAVEKFSSVDVLVNSAGYQHVASIENFPEEKWNNMLSVMLTAPFLLTKYAWPHMQKKKWGRVINIASIHALVASHNKAAYITAKHGLLGLTRSAALEGGAHGITVNALCPSYVRTPLVDGQITAQAQAHGISESQVIEDIMLKPAAIKRLIEPEEISNIVLLLCSEKSASITGANWTIDCGWTSQ